MTEVQARVAEVSDEELMQRVQGDDSDAFSALYDRFAGRVYSVVHRIARDRGRAEDVHQETFISVWRGRAKFDPGKGTVSSWILRIAQHRAIDSVRNHRRHDERLLDDPWIAEHAPAPGDVTDRVAERDQAAKLRGALARLPQAQRDVIALAYFGELSSTEIADRMSIPLGTVKGRIRLGLEKLRREQLPRAARVPERAAP